MGVAHSRCILLEMLAICDLWASPFVFLVRVGAVGGYSAVPSFGERFPRMSLSRRSSGTQYITPHEANISRRVDQPRKSVCGFDVRSDRYSMRTNPTD